MANFFSLVNVAFFLIGISMFGLSLASGLNCPTNKIPKKKITMAKPMHQRAGLSEFIRQLLVNFVGWYFTLFCRFIWGGLGILARLGIGYNGHRLFKV